MVTGGRVAVVVCVGWGCVCWGVAGDGVSAKRITASLIVKSGDDDEKIRCGGAVVVGVAEWGVGGI